MAAGGGKEHTVFPGGYSHTLPIRVCAAQRSPHVRESKTVLDSGFHAVDSEFQLLDSRSYTVELGFRIPIVSGIPDSHSCIPDSNSQDSGFHKQKFPRFRILHAKISRIPESGFLYMGRQRGRDFEAPDLERGIHFRGIF